MHWLIWVLITLPLGGLLDGYEHRNISTGPLYSKGWGTSQVRWAETYLPETLNRTEARLGRHLGRPFSTLLVGGYGELTRVVEALGGSPPDRYTRGVAFPGRLLIVVRGDLVDSPVPGDPRAATIAHEVAHLVIHRRPDVRIPRWIDEGIAEWAAGGRLAPRDEAEISLLARTGSIYRFATLEKGFPSGRVSTTLAYRQSHLIMRFIAERHGEAAIVALLDSLEAGQSAGRALEGVTGLPLDRLEEEFRRWAAARCSLVGALIVYLNVWTLIGILALVAIGCYLVRRRRGMGRLEAQERQGTDTAPPAGEHEGGPESEARRPAEDE